MPIGLKQLEDALSVNKNVAREVARQLPGASKGPAPLDPWVIPDDALEYISLHPEILDQAFAAVRSKSSSSATTSTPSSSTPASRAGVSDDETELRRSRVRLERDRVEVDRLEMEVRRAELERKRGGSSSGGGIDATVLLLLDRLNGVERKLDGSARGAGGASDLAALVTAIAPVATALIARRPGADELLAQLAKAQPDPLSVARGLKDLGLVGSSQDTTGTLARAKELLEFFTLMRSAVGHEQGGGDGFWVELARSLGPQIPDMVGRAADAVKNFSAARIRVAEIGRRGATPASPAPAVAAFQAELDAAAAHNDHNYFGLLQQRILELWPQGGAELLAAVAADPAADAVALERLGQGGIRFTPTVTTFLKTFAGWLRYTVRRQAGAAPAGPAATNGAGAQVRARCERCQTVFDLDSEEHWASDSRVCDVQGPAGPCGGTLVRIEMGHDEEARR